MTKETYHLIENYMRACMEDSAHDREHVYRVLYNALQIARQEPDVDLDVLVTACLLHDIGRKEQFDDPSLCHAAVGSEKAYSFLKAHEFSEEFSEAVRRCILAHRFRRSHPPESIEAKILFDADKLDATGALGIARTLLYQGDMAEPLYTLLPNGSVCDGTQNDVPSFFREYHFKLKHLYGKFYTASGAALARERRTAAESFYENLYREVTAGRAAAQAFLGQWLE